MQGALRASGWRACRPASVAVFACCALAGCGASGGGGGGGGLVRTGVNAPADTSQFGGPPAPDRSGSELETGISGYVSASSTAPTAVRVRCPHATFAPHSRMTCTGTRPAGDGELYHYTIAVQFGPDNIEYLDIDSHDDLTGTIVERDKHPTRDQAPG